MKVYLIPGLGADSRMYDSLLASGIDGEVLEWFKPLPDESFSDYVERFSRQIKRTESFAIIGTSFGGIMALELSKILDVEKIILISSVKCRKELPPYIRIGKYISIVRKSTGHFYSKVNRFLVNLLRLKSQEEFLKRAIEMSKNADDDFIKWAIDKVMRWENKTYSHRILHLHGTRDVLFPIVFIRNCIRIDGGTHMMVMEKDIEINSLILEHLNS